MKKILTILANKFLLLFFLIFFISKVQAQYNEGGELNEVIIVNDYHDDDPANTYYMVFFDEPEFTIADIDNPNYYWYLGELNEVIVKREEKDPKEESWGKDSDGDNYYVNEVSSVIQPGSDYKKTVYMLGQDCDDNDRNKTTICDLTADCNITVTAIHTTFGGDIDILRSVLDAINKYASTLGIDSDLELRHFLAQCAVESNNFTKFKEGTSHQTKTAMGLFGRMFNGIGDENKVPGRKNLSDFGTYTVNDKTYIKDKQAYFNHIYSDTNRANAGYSLLGNDEVGDGYKYLGRGAIQLTGRDNYEKFGAWYSKNINSNINLVQNPELLNSNKEIGTLAALWFFKTQVMNKLGGINSNTDVDKVTRRINSGMEKKKVRRTNFNKSILTIKCN